MIHPHNNNEEFVLHNIPLNGTHFSHHQYSTYRFLSVHKTYSISSINLHKHGVIHCYQSFCCFHHLFSSRIHLKFLPINFSIAWHKSQAESNIPPPSCFINSLSSNSTNIAFLLSRLNISSCIYHFNALVLFGKISVLFGNKL